MRWNQVPESVSVPQGIDYVARNMLALGGVPRFLVIPYRANVSLRAHQIRLAVSEGLDVVEPDVLTEVRGDGYTLEVILSPLCPPDQIYVLQDDPRPFDAEFLARLRKGADDAPTP